MVSANHITFAYTCARSMQRGADVQRAAILCLRVLVEDRGASVDDAMAAISGAFPLGLREMHDIRQQAAARYGVAA